MSLPTLADRKHGQNLAVTILIAHAENAKMQHAD